MKKNQKKIRGSKKIGMPAIHEKIVEQLAQGIEMVQEAPAVVKQWALWCGMASIFMLALLWLFSVRTDLKAQLVSPVYGLTIFLLLAGAALAAWGALESSLPSEELSGRWKYRAALGFWFVALLFFVFLSPHSGNYPLVSWPCFLKVFVMGTVSWLALGFFLSRNAPLHPGRTGFWSGLSAFLLGSLLVTLDCGSQNLTHVVLEHFLPVLVYSSLTAWVGYRWFSRWKRKPLGLRSTLEGTRELR